MDIMLNAIDGPPLFAQAMHSAGHDIDELSLGAEEYRGQPPKLKPPS